MGLFSDLFTWWHGDTLGTRLYTWRKGERVGEDGLGNVYYRERNGTRRWVIYKDLSEASQIPPGWHAWIHFITDEPPSDCPGRSPAWPMPSTPGCPSTTMSRHSIPITWHGC